MSNIGSTDNDRSDQSDSFLTVAEIASQYRTTPRTVQRWIRQGRLKAVRGPGGRRYLVDRAELIAAIEATA